MFVRNLLGGSSVVFALAAGPVVQPPVAHAPVPMTPPVGLALPPAARVRPALGPAPRPQFQVEQQTVKVDPKEPGVRAVRAMPPQNFDPACRNRTVREFYAKQAATDGNVASTATASKPVGPYRREFVAWACRWALRDRAWWAWNNYAYFDRLMWREWMLDREFAALIAGYDASGRTPVLGFIPDQYAASPAEAIYNDDYIEAVYNPVYTTPSIVVDGSTGGRLGNLVEGVPRVFGRQNRTIGSVARHGVGLQFVSIPAGFDPTYLVEVKRDGDLFIFGPKQTPLADGLGADATNWRPVHDVVVGTGIDVVYQRHVAAGEHIRLHGVEWSIASEQIELLSNATPAARTAVSLVDAELGQMVKEDGPIFDAAPELKDYLRIAQGAEQAMLTPLGNVNDEKVGLYYAALAKTQKVCLATTSASVDHRLTASGTDLVRQVKGLADSMGEVDELRDPSAEPKPAPASATIVDSGGPPVTLVPEPPASGWTDHARTTGRRVNLLAAVDLNRDVISGTWTANGGALDCDGASGTPKLLEFGSLPPDEYDFEVTFVERGNMRSTDLICAVGGQQFYWQLGDMNGTFYRFGLVNGGGDTMGRTSLVAGQRYTTVVKVRRDGAHAYLDGRELAHVDTDYSNVSLPRRLKLRAMNTLGLALFADHTTIESATLKEVGGDAPSSAAPPTRAPTMVAQPPPIASGGGSAPEPSAMSPDGAVSGTLCVRLMCDLPHGDSLGVYLNGVRIASMEQDTVNATLHVPATLRSGDVLGFRASDRFADHSLRFAFVGPDGAPLFGSRASSTVLREQYNARAPFPRAPMAGDVARVGRCAMGEDQAWAQERLPYTAEWIGLPKPNTLYDLATTVPDLRSALGQSGATAPVPSSPAAPTVRGARPRTAPNLAEALGPVGTVWVPVLKNQQGESLTVLSVDATTVDFRYSGADGSTSRWSFEVTPTGQIKQTACAMIHAPANPPVVSDIQVHITLSGNHLLVRGSRQLDGVLNRVILTLARQP